MFRRVRRVQSVLEFLRDRVPHYGPLVRDDLHQFREEIVKASVGACLGAAAGLFFACFLSVAVIVTSWEGAHRIAVAWAICVGWGALAMIGLWYARQSTLGPPPFRQLGASLALDYAHLLKIAEHDES